VTDFNKRQFVLCYCMTNRHCQNYDSLHGVESFLRSWQSFSWSKFPRNLWNPMVYNVSLLHPILSQMNPIHNLQNYDLHINFKSRSSGWVRIPTFRRYMVIPSSRMRSRYPSKTLHGVTTQTTSTWNINAVKVYNPVLTNYLTTLYQLFRLFYLVDLNNNN
jgi:hypothetical protein